MLPNIDELIKQIIAQQGIQRQPPVGISDPNPQQLPGGTPPGGQQFSPGHYTQLAQQMSGMFGPQGQPGQPPLGSPQPPGMRIPGNPMGPGIFGGQGNYRNDQFGGYLSGRRNPMANQRLY
jgi:hypothetical protein